MNRKMKQEMSVEIDLIDLIYLFGIISLSLSLFRLRKIEPTAFVLLHTYGDTSQ